MHPRRATAAVVGLASMLVQAAAPRAEAAEWITFDAPPERAVASHGAPSPVRAYLATPVEPGPHPGVVLLSGCAGQRAFHQSWARALAARGYAALLVDHYFMHDRGMTCSGGDRNADRQMRLRHALGAAAHLRGVPGVDPSRIAVMGWDDAPLEETLRAAPAPLAAAVSITPDGCPGTASPGTPRLVLLAGAAQRPVPACAEEAPAIERITYPDAYPGFDDPRAGERRRSGAGRGARRYDRLAHASAVDDVVAFLDRHLPVEESAEHRYAQAPRPPVPARGTWAIDPSDPGPDLPPSGASAFDRVFSRASAEGPVHDVPFPFERLLAELEAQAGADRMARRAVDATLIPLGRSLQREAAAPDYFESPRIVAAVTHEATTGPLTRMPLANRLFLGYQPRAGVIEVISYNDEAARFEFQIVSGYRAGGKPTVRYARRALCTSCHQNGAPIFSEAPWEETGANRRVVARLRGLGARFHGVTVDEDDRGVAAIDSASDEANLLPVLQLLWRAGCRGRTVQDTAACRAGALQAMLQYRLSGGAGFDRGEPLYEEGYLVVQGQRWRERWADGLLVPSSSLPDRSPLMQTIPSSVLVSQDPLRPRPPGQRWTASARDLERPIRALARVLPEQLDEHLDRHLRELDRHRPARTLDAPCTILRRGVGTGALEIECAAGPGAPGFGVRAMLRERPDGRIEGSADWLGLPGGFYAGLRAAGTIESGVEERRVVLALARPGGGTPVRAPTGDAIETLTLRWSLAAAGGARRWRAAGSVELARDFDPVRRALRDAAARPAGDSPLVAERFDGRFDGRALAGWILEQLGAPPIPACCDARPRAAPPARAETDRSPTSAALDAALEHRGPLQTLGHYCAACHGGDTRNPPGFLRGDLEAQRLLVEHCAERIYYRLSMWRRAPGRRGVSPMPPLQGLHLAGVSEERWRRGDSLARLIAYVGDTLEAQGTRPEAVLGASYPSTRGCLP